MKTDNRYLFAIGLAGAATLPATAVLAAGPDGGARPNVVIVYADDMGYGDLGCYGHPTINTPNLDRMAGEGMLMKSFYAGAAVSTPSRAALLTGRYAVRSGMYGDTWSVLYPDAPEGLPRNESTFLQIASEAGYRTACVGKWHLGSEAPYMPADFGFDYYFGVPYANNFRPLQLQESRGQHADLEVLEENTDQRLLTQRYTEKIVGFITENRDNPFIVYYPTTTPHIPLSASTGFEGKSLRGAYGDSVEELDWSVGRIIETLVELGLDDNTMVVFTSDNGPWTRMHLRGGSSGMLRGGKGSAWEGGYRVPALFRWPGVIPAGSVCYNPAGAMDLFSTVVNLCGGEIPADRPIDAVDLMPMLRDPEKGVRNEFAYWCGSRLRAVRMGPWKLVAIPYEEWFTERGLDYDENRMLLFNIEHDPGETVDMTEYRPEIAGKLAKLREKYLRETKVAPSVCDNRAMTYQNQSSQNQSPQKK